MLRFRGAPIQNAQPLFEDSFYVPRFVQEPAAMEAALNATAPWTDPTDARFRWRGNKLPRQKFFLNDAPTNAPLDEPPATIRKYSYPGFQYTATKEYRPIRAVPVVCDLVELMQRDLTFDGAPIVVNHVIGTRYRDARDNISYHSDKVQDIAPGSPIVSLSFGEVREFHIGRPDPADPKKTIFERAIVLGAGDLFVLGPRTNAAHRHVIVPVSDERVLERDVDAAIQPRISLVFRHISTQMTQAQVRAKIAQKKRAADGEVIVKRPHPTRRHKPGQE